MSTSRLPYLPVNIASLLEMQWYLHSDAEIVRAGMYLLDAAWRSSVPGSVPSSFTVLCQITRLSDDKIQSNYDLLMCGWELREDARLYLPALHDLAVNVTERFGDQLEVLAQSAVVSMQSVESFDLVPTDAVKKVAKKRQTAKARIDDFVPDGTSLASIVGGGYRTPEHQDWLIGSFKDYIASKQPKYKDIQATFRTFAASSYTHNTFKSRFGVVPATYLKPAAIASLAPGHASPAPGAVGAKSFAARQLDENRAILERMRVPVPSMHIKPPTRPGAPAAVKTVLTQRADGLFDAQGNV